MKLYKLVNQKLYESELNKLTNEIDRNIFRNIYKSKSIRLEIFIKTIHNQILSFKIQLNYLYSSLSINNKDKEDGDHNNDKLFNINNNNNKAVSTHNNENYSDNKAENNSATIKSSLRNRRKSTGDYQYHEIEKDQSNCSVGLSRILNNIFNFLMFYYIMIMFYLKPPSKGRNEEKRTYIHR